MAPGVGEILGRTAVGDPGSHLDAALEEGREDLLEIGGEGIARGQKRKFPAVEIRVAEGDVLAADADKNDGAAMGGQPDGILHGAGVAGGVEDDVGAVGVGSIPGRGEAGAGLEGHGGGGGKESAAGGQAGWVEVDHGDGQAPQEKKLQDGEANGTGPDYGRRFISEQAGPADGVAADGEGFDEGQFLKGKPWRWVKMAAGEDQGVAHASVGMHAEAAGGSGAVGFAAGVGAVARGGGVGLDGAAVAGPEVVYTRADGFNFHPQFVAHHQRITDKRVAAME